MNRLKEHPFAVDALFERSLVLTFAVPKEEVAGLIPPCLSLDTHQDKWAFIAVAMVQTKNLRPKGFPKFMGSDFFLIGYRVFVRYTNAQGKRLRGLYILKSETDSRRMTFFGNMLPNIAIQQQIYSSKAIRVAKPFPPANRSSKSGYVKRLVRWHYRRDQSFKIGRKLDDLRVRCLLPLPMMQAAKRFSSSKVFAKIGIQNP